MGKKYIYSWPLTYYGWFGPGDSSDDLPYTASVSKKEYDILIMFTQAEENCEPVDADSLPEEKQKTIERMSKRIQKKIEECEAENYGKGETMPDICIRWPW